MTDKLTFEGPLVIAFDEHPAARVLELSDTTEGENGVFVRLHSWSDTGEHPEIEQFRGQKVRITVETVDE